MLVVPAYAKVNLTLEVTARRPDGWHDIASVICTIDWHDLVGVSIRCTTAAPGEPIRLQQDGPFADGVSAGSDNLAARAAHRLRDVATPPGTTFDIRLVKNIPAAAGLGGGSADAAATLRAGATLLAQRGHAIPPQRQVELAAELGSDVPALLAGGTVLATGRGEQLAPLPTPRLHLAVAVAGASATAAAYAALDDSERRATGRATAHAAALQPQGPPPPGRTNLDLALLGSALEPAACRAAAGLAGNLARLRAATPATSWYLTGSGGAAFALAATAAEATDLAARARATGFTARACRTVPARLGPLPQTAP